MERKEKRYKESREFNIFCNYGVTGKEKRRCIHSVHLMSLEYAVTA